MEYLLAMEFLFNHESPRRGNICHSKNNKIFNKKKIRLKDILYLGNLNAMRDWGHAKDYVEMQWRILQQKKPDDFVIATGQTQSVKQFIDTAAKLLDMKLLWQGKGLNEKCYLINNKKRELLIKIDKKYFRPNEVNYLRGDARKAFKMLRFKPKYSFKDLVKDMITSDLKLAKLEKNKTSC